MRDLHTFRVSVSHDKAIGSGIVKKPRKPNARTQIVKQVMNKTDLSMIEAINFFKANNLY